MMVGLSGGRVFGFSAVSCSHPVECVNCHEHFRLLRPLIREVVVSSHFLRDAPGFDVRQVVDCEREYSPGLHKLEENVDGIFVFRSLRDGKHVVYAVDRGRRLVFLRAFNNFKAYKKFLEDRKGIREMVSRA